MRVLQLHAAYRQRGGEDAVVEAEAGLLRTGGHQVFQLQATNPAQNRAAMGLLAQTPWNLGAARAVAHAVRDNQPDVAHVHNTWFALGPAVLSPLGRAGVPVVMTLHNYRLTCISSDLFRDGSPCTDCLGGSPLPGVRHRCYRNSLLTSAVAATDLSIHRARRTWQRGVDRFIAPTAFAAELLIRAGISAERLTVKPHFTWDPGPERLPCSASEEVLYVGRLADGKGADLLLRAWAANRPGRLRLTVVGDGPLRTALERLAPPSVRFVGWEPRDQVRQRMLECRALAFPATWYEPFGMVLIEALSAGLPVVGYDVAGVRSIVQPSHPGMLVPTGDVEQLARAITLLEDDTLVDEVSVSSRAQYLTNFTPAQNLPLLESVYCSVL